MATTASSCRCSTSTFLSVPITPPQKLPIVIRISKCSTFSSSNIISHTSSSVKLIPVARSSSASSVPAVQQKEEEEKDKESEVALSSDDGSVPQSEMTTDSDSVPLGGCKACGREEIERGCNGEGRIQGGIATVPGFGWWPIKAYRPCPGFVASGGRYSRQGQSMDEVVSGGGDRRASRGTASAIQSSKKKQGARKFKG